MKMVGGGITRSYEADTALGAGLCVVAGAKTTSVKLPVAAGDRALGVTGYAVSGAGYPATVVELGEVKATAAAAIARGDMVEVAGASGKVQTSAPAAGTNRNIVGMALEAAAADGDEILILVMPQVRQG
jgi:hypothetical protein